MKTGMTDDTSSLDEHRGMAAQRATEVRREKSEVRKDQLALRGRRDELEKFLFAAPAENWSAAVAKARYLLSLFARRPPAMISAIRRSSRNCSPISTAC